MDRRSRSAAATMSWPTLMTLPDESSKGVPLLVLLEVEGLPFAMASLATTWKKE